MRRIKKSEQCLLVCISMGLFLFVGIGFPTIANNVNYVDLTPGENPKAAAPSFSVSVMDWVKLPNLGQAIKVTPDGKYAVVMESSGTLHIINITDVTDIAEIGTYARDVYGYGDLAIRGNYVYVTSDVKDTIEVVDISNPTTLTSMKNFSLPDAYGIDIKDAYAYVGEDVSDFDGNGAHFCVVNLTDPVNIANVTNLSLWWPNGNPIYNVEVVGNYAYVRCYPYQIVIVDISDPRNPMNRSYFPIGSFNDFTMYDSRAYIVNYVTMAYHLEVYDVTNPDNPTSVYTPYYTRSSGDFYSVDVVGQCAVAGRFNEIMFLSRNEPYGYDESKFLIGSLTTPGHTIFEVRALPQPGHFLTIDETGNVTLYYSPNCVLLPSAPQNAVGSLSGAQIVLTWQQPSSTGGVSLSGYNVYRATKSGGPYTLLGTSTGLTYTDTSGTVGVTYYYMVKAINSGGEGVNSNEVSVSIPKEGDGILGYPLIWITLLCLYGTLHLIRKTNRNKHS